MILRLYAIAEDHWPVIDAYYIDTNLLHLPMYRFLNAIYAWCVDRVDPEKREMWEMMLREPLEGRKTKVTPMTEEEEGLAFMAAMQAVKG